MSLLRTAARASVATRVIGNTQRRQQAQWAAQDAAAAQAASATVPVTAGPVAGAPVAAAPVAGASGHDAITLLTQIASLHGAGILTDSEVELAKQRVIAHGI
ncbi:SHOCT domain-containing protein [Sanguibacter sp. HDW7]|uniref:SHOCT domain-containing protein n=1 Tax=Sanguibacter sp. HDW7 TaxID=2714931 RepID=UPI00140C19E3|nr:SHOCT domain-containing protein [Sanguibacter sp. HDW7]QIK82453.1 SHOCT domain-containing protein [Sanguibacter sp. HDW7]